MPFRFIYSLFTFLTKAEFDNKKKQNCIYIVCWKTQTRTNYKNHTSKELGHRVKCQTLFFTVTSGFDNYKNKS